MNDTLENNETVEGDGTETDGSEPKAVGMGMALTDKTRKNLFIWLRNYFSKGGFVDFGLVSVFIRACELLGNYCSQSFFFQAMSLI